MYINQTTNIFAHEKEAACFLVCLKQDERQSYRYKTRHPQFSTTQMFSRSLVQFLFDIG